MDIEISIIIPFYNAEAYLGRCLKSICSQKFKEYECICVNDKSTDNGLEICLEYTKNDNRIKIINNNTNQGSSLSRKTGLDAAKGKYILFIDADDWIEQDMLEKMYKKIVSNNNDIVFCDYYEERNGKSRYMKIPVKELDTQVLLKEIFNERFSHVLWNKLVKKEIYMQVLFPHDSWAEDRVITIQGFYYAKRIGYINEALHHYCYNEKSMGNDKTLKIKRINERLNNWKAVLDFLWDKYGEKINEFEPGLSNYTNKAIKAAYMENKEIRDPRIVFEIYPYSNNHIFNKSLKINFVRKIFLFLSVKNITIQYKIMDIIWNKNIQNIYRKIYSIMRYVYRLSLKEIDGRKA